MNEPEKESASFVWTPITLTDKATGRRVSISIFERELYLSGFFTFEDLWEITRALRDVEEQKGDE